MATPSVKCQRAVEKDHEKVMPGLSPQGGHSSQVFRVMTAGGLYAAPA